MKEKLLTTCFFVFFCPSLVLSVVDKVQLKQHGVQWQFLSELTSRLDRTENLNHDYLKFFVIPHHERIIANISVQTLTKNLMPQQPYILTDCDLEIT